MANEYAKEMSEKLMTATASEMAEIAEDIAYSVYIQLSPAAKARVDEAVSHLPED